MASKKTEHKSIAVLLSSLKWPSSPSPLSSPPLFLGAFSSSFVIRLRGRNLLGMAPASETVTFAVRSPLVIDLTQPSGTDDAWSTVDSPTLGRMSSLNVGTAVRRNKSAFITQPPKRAKVPPLDLKRPGAAPLNIKKIRRQGLIADSKLDLPSSPRPSQPRISASPPSQTSLTFTAEWDLTRQTFVLTPTPSEAGYPPSLGLPFSAKSPVPEDVISTAETLAIAGRNQATRPLVLPPSPLVSVATPQLELFTDDDKSSMYSWENLPRGLLTTSAPASTDLTSSQPKELPLTPPNRSVSPQKFKNESTKCINSRSVEFDKCVYDGMDEDLLLTPMDVFERMLWDSTETEPRRSQIHLDNRLASEGLPTQRCRCQERPPPLPPKPPALSRGKSSTLPNIPLPPPKHADRPPFRHSRNKSSPPPMLPSFPPKGLKKKRNFSLDLSSAFAWMKSKR